MHPPCAAKSLRAGRKSGDSHRYFLADKAVDTKTRSVQLAAYLESIAEVFAIPPSYWYNDVEDFPNWRLRVLPDPQARFSFSGHLAAACASPPFTIYAVFLNRFMK